MQADRGVRRHDGRPGSDAHANVFKLIIGGKPIKAIL
jgi:hypothetical protein